MDHRDAECLDASWTNRGTFKKSTFRVQNRCATYGTVVAKVDLVAASDMTLHLDRRKAGTRPRVAPDQIDLLLLRHGYLQQVRRGHRRGVPGADHAGEHGAAELQVHNRLPPPVPARTTMCTIQAECYRDSNTLIFATWSSTITVPFVALGDVHNCEGRLRRGPCDDDPVDTTRVRVLDATAYEDRLMNRNTLNFRVFLSRRLRIPVQVDYATSDGTAHAGSDYRAASGTLTFRPGETAKTISVQVLEDSHNEGDELYDAHAIQPAPVAAGATCMTRPRRGGSPTPTPCRSAWIGRFGRTVADQVLDAVDDRMRAKPAPGVEAHVAGQRIGPGPTFAADPQGDPMSGAADATGLRAADERARAAPRYVVRADRGDRRQKASSRSGAGVR